MQVLFSAADAVNLSAIHSWYMGSRKRTAFYLEMGYSAALQNQPWVVQTGGVELSDVSKRVLKFIQPGGIILGLGFNFGF